MTIKSKYFNIREWMKYLNLSMNEDWMLIVDSPRNIGKSTSCWHLAEEEVWIKSNFTKKVAYWRTNLTKLKKQIESFNAHFQGKYYMTENRIYKIEFDEEGKEIRAARKEIGAVMGVSNYLNYKSNWFEDFQMIFWDEYNETHQPKIYEAFIDLAKTVKRANKPFHIILCGNRCDGDSDMLVNLEIDVPDNFEEDYIQYITNNVIYVAIGTNTYNQIEANNPNDLIHVLASKSSTTNRYLNEGGYLKQRSEFIKLWKHIDAEGYEPVRTLTFRDRLFEEGIFGENDAIYFRYVDKPDPSIPIISLDTLGWMSNEKSFNWVDEEFYQMWARRLKYAIKNKQLFFTSNDCMIDLFDYIVRNTEFIE